MWFKKFIKSVNIVRFCIIMLLPLSLFLRIAAEKIDGFSEWYEENIYRYISLAFGSISGFVPFSIAEIIVVFVPIIFLVYAVFIIVRLIIRKKDAPKKAYKFLLNTVCIISACLFLFMTNCGINYYRLYAADIYSLKPQAVSTEKLCQVCIKLAEGAAKAREKLEKDKNNNTIFVDSDTAEKTNTALNSLAEKYPRLSYTGAKPKSIILSRLMSYTHITGVFFPFTFEANVNTDVVDYTIPATMCHELAHTCGIMREDEANFTSFLACIQSGEPQLEYSGYMLAYAYASNALYKADKEKYYIADSHISDEMRDDFIENNEYWKQFETPVAQAASAVNNSYLKSNSQSDGVRSYDNVTDLVIAYYS